MATTAVPRLASLPLPPFEKFLCAPIGVESNGMTLTVMSAFARLDLDPWEKTSQLVALGRPAAITSLRDIIARLPMPSLRSDEPLASMAERLAGLLPDSARPIVPAIRPAASLVRLWWFRGVVFFVVVFLCWKAAGMLPF